MFLSQSGQHLLDLPILDNLARQSKEAFIWASSLLHYTMSCGTYRRADVVLRTPGD